MWSRLAVVCVFLSASCHAGLLGAGTGEGSCAAAPFRSVAVKWAGGCPAYASCCSEYGYCRPEAEWAAGSFRDCNGVSNGTPLPEDALQAEAIAAASGDASAAGILVLPAGATTAGAGAAGYAAAAPLPIIQAGASAAVSQAAAIKVASSQAAASQVAASQAAAAGGLAFAGAPAGVVGAAGFGYAGFNSLGASGVYGPAGVYNAA